MVKAIKEGASGITTHLLATPVQSGKECCFLYLPV